MNAFLHTKSCHSVNAVKLKSRQVKVRLMFIYIWLRQDIISRLDYWFRNSMNCTKGDRYTIILPRDSIHSAYNAVTRCPSVCLSLAGIVLKRLNIPSNFIHSLIAIPFYFFTFLIS